MTWTVYRFYDAHDDLLYVGCTGRLKIRISHHRSQQPWFPQVARTATEDFENKVDALNHERDLILSLVPRYNLNGRNGGVESSTKPIHFSMPRELWNDFRGRAEREDRVARRVLFLLMKKYADGSLDL